MGKKHITYETHHHRVAPAYPQEIHNYAAPTADTAQLLRELEKEAFDNIIKGYSFKDNDLHGVVVLRRMKASTFGQVVYLKYSLNGQTYECDIDWDPNELEFIPARALELLWEKVSKTVASQLHKCILEELIKSDPGRGR